MINPHYFRQIKHLILKYLQGTISDNETAVLNTWLEMSVENKKLLDRITGKDFLAEVISVDNNSDREKALFEERWEMLKRATIDKDVSTKPQLSVKHPRLNIARTLRLAAVAVVCIPIVFAAAVWMIKSGDIESSALLADYHSPKAVVYWADGSTTTFASDSISQTNRTDTIILNKNATTTVSNDTYDKIVIPKGEIYVVKLSDGTIVHLSPESELEIPTNYSASNRRVRLEGQAFFDVITDKSSPFTVRSAGTYVTALGTCFEVSGCEKTGLTKATLVSGKIEVATKLSKIILNPGLQAYVSQTGYITVNSIDANLYTAWIRGRLVFDNQSISSIVTELERWYDYKFIVENESVSNVHMTMNVPRSCEITELITVMEKIEKVKFRIENQTIYVK